MKNSPVTPCGPGSPQEPHRFFTGGPYGHLLEQQPEQARDGTGAPPKRTAVPQDLRLPRRATDPEVAAAAEEIGQQWFTRGRQELEDYLRHREAYGEWADAVMHSYGGTRLTPDELKQFGEEYIAFLIRWHRGPGEDTPGAQHITVLFNAFPSPDGRSAAEGERA